MIITTTKGKRHMKQQLLLLCTTGILFLAGCASTPAPAAESMAGAATPHSEMADGEMTDGEMTDGEMADGEIADGEMTDDAMADDEMADDAMAEGEMADGEMDDGEMADDAMADGEMTDDAMADDAMADDAMADDAMAAMELPAWQTLPLADARTGQVFTLADFSGKTVFVEPMATWCSNCRRQLNNVKEAKAQFGDDVVFVALSVETNISGEELANYAEAEGFDWTFAVLTPEMLQELAGAFGQTISNPPATPHFIIHPDGAVSALVTGIESAADIATQIAAAKS